MKKKVLAVLLTGLMALSMTACGSSSSESSDASADAAAAEADDAADGESDSDYVKANGKLVVGITDFAPMDYKEDGDWIGFDADMAKAFGEKLGVEVEFVEIDWDNKVLELDNKTIDCVWNGMTLTDEVTSAMECSNAYCNNAQVVVVPEDIADDCQEVSDLSDMTFAVEAGSAGEEQAEENSLESVAVQNQASALMEVAGGTADGAIIDSLMAGAMIGEGTSYENLTATVGLNSEEYGVGFRKGSDLAEELNTFLKESYDDGSMMEIAETYGVQLAVIEQ